jgi:nitrogen fixation NifU-like protein
MDFDQLYSKKVMQHIRNPKNMGEIKDADGVATIGNRACGDIMRLYIKVERRGKQEFIKDIKFQTLGCGAAIATSSMITTLVKGKPLEEAAKITEETLTEALDGLPQIKIHCSVLAGEALKKAIEDYQAKKQLI